MWAPPAVQKEVTVEQQMEPPSADTAGAAGAGVERGQADAQHRVSRLGCGVHLGDGVWLYLGDREEHGPRSRQDVGVLGLHGRRNAQQCRGTVGLAFLRLGC